MYSSAILSFRVKGSPSFPFRDRSHSHSHSHSHSFADRFDKCGLPFSSPSASCCCSCSCSCCCCSFSGSYGHSNSRVPISPSLLYELRQSSLLQRSASRALILNGRDRCYYQCPDYGIRGDIHEVSCVSKKRVEKGNRKKIVCMVLEGSSEIPRLSRYEDADAVLSLLCEDVESESFLSKERRASSSKRVEVEKRKTYGTENSRGRKKKFSSDLNESKCHELVSARSKREGNASKKDREEDLLRREDRKTSKSTCSCSSYYTVSASGDYTSETEEIKGDRLSDFSAGYADEMRNKEETKIGKETMRHYEDVKETEFSQKRDSAVRSNAEWDCRKKSEKKLNEVSAGEVQSNKEESSLVKSRTTRSHEYDESKASSSQKRFTVKDERLNVDIKVESLAGKSHSQAASEDIGQSELRRKQQSAEVFGVCRSGDISSSPQSHQRLAGREETVISSSSGFRDDSRPVVTKSPRQHSGTLRIQEIDSEEISAKYPRKQSGTLRIQDIDSENTSAKYPRQHSGTLRIQEIDSEDTSAKYPWQHSGTLRIQEIDSQNTSEVQGESYTRVNKWEQNKNMASTSAYKEEEQNVQRDEQVTRQSDVRKSTTTLLETRQNIESTYISNKKHLEETTNSVSYSYPNPREQQPRTNQDTLHILHSREESSIGQNKSLIDKERVAYSQRTSEEKMSDSSSNITLVVNLGEGVSRSQDQTTQKVAQTEAQKEDKSRANVFSSPVTVSEVSLSTKQTLNLIQQEQKQFNVYQGASTLTPIVPSSQLVTGESEYIQGVSTKEGRGSNPGPALTQGTHTGATSPSFEFDGDSRTDEISGTTLQLKTDGDALGSAQRSEQLSSQFIGEFIQKASNDVLSSQTQTSISGTDFVSQDQDQTQTSSSQLGLEVQSEGNNSGNIAGGSVTEGPSEEKWLVTDSTTQQSAKVDLLGESASGGKIVKRTGKSLWAMIADIVRLRWGPHAETPRSAALSGKKSPSFDSATSETWFSGHEQGSTPVEEATPSERLQTVQGFSETQTEESSRHFEEQLSHPITPASSPSSTRTSSIILQEGFGWREYEKHIESAPEALTGRATPAVGATSVTSEPLSRSSSMEMTEQPGAGELKQRKLLRNKQVLKDRFDEWEEAYILESEQRKIDEMFMREALIEASKAADNWEVPVGAVLVKEGKIIARGCNRVEELRDSTAHAEMICIREASNILNTWRLSGGTLYVTLEPCPMCAGAILQARVDNLVWGAPNKLLGADGSWIRLFPSGEGGDGSETSDKPAPPPHPFHPKMTITRGVLASECANKMQQFFQLRRRKKAREERPPTPPSCLPISPHPAKLLKNIFHMPFCL